MGLEKTGGGTKVKCEPDAHVPKEVKCGDRSGRGSKAEVSTGPCHLSHIWIHAASILVNGEELLGGVEVRVLAKVTTDRPHGHQGQPPAPRPGSPPGKF